ncbi:spore coat protein [Bacillus sp. T33-2]|uniref:spore coat protein n=1 Tax=Bacillus sp. T33-2 TaxID=2054168 RepID=UPI000C7812C1|nr:spore coat protein [Bacillus sp. T33-2]PLR93783.1 spore coat protein [Bacillus sp. T33-2]
MAKQNRLAWHETLELHELVAFQSVLLWKFKKNVRKVTEPELRALYAFSINALENNLRELLRFYPMAPGFPEAARAEIGFFAGDLLGSAKTAVRYYAIAVTETATPALREVLTRQLNTAIDWHGRVFYYMYERGLYPSYDLQKLLMNDVNLASKALSE